jgi:hypothetical protein
VLSFDSGAATSISPDWEKPAPNQTSFTKDGVTCGATGDGGDRETNRLKNRTALPQAGYHDVTFDAIANLGFPTAPKHRHDWTDAQLEEIRPFEGVAVRVVGYLVAIKPQGGSGETTNCHMTSAAATDWHVALVKNPGDGEEEAIVIETTPRVRRDHPKWTVGRLNDWLDSPRPVRISGWLMLDPSHRNHIGTFRSSLWEIHPITEIEVFKDEEERFVDLDELP